MDNNQWHFYDMVTVSLVTQLCNVFRPLRNNTLLIPTVKKSMNNERYTTDEWSYTLHTHTQFCFCVMFLVSQLIDGNKLTVSYLPWWWDHSYLPRYLVSLMSPTVTKEEERVENCMKLHRNASGHTFHFFIISVFPTVTVIFRTRHKVTQMNAAFFTKANNGFLFFHDVLHGKCRNEWWLLC